MLKTRKHGENTRKIGHKNILKQVESFGDSKNRSWLCGQKGKPDVETLKYC